MKYGVRGIAVSPNTSKHTVIETQRIVEVLNIPKLFETRMSGHRSKEQENLLSFLKWHVVLIQDTGVIAADQRNRVTSAALQHFVHLYFIEHVRMFEM